MLALLLALIAGCRAEAVPPTPQGLSVYPGDGWVVVTWYPNEEQELVTQYVVFRTPPWPSGSTRELPGFEAGPGCIGAVPRSGINASTYDSRMFWDFGLVNGASYSYVVRSVGGGAWADSGSITVTPDASTAVIGNPTARPGNGFVDLQWALKRPDDESGISGYVIYRSTAPGLWSTVYQTSDVSATNFIDSPLPNDRLCQYMIIPWYPLRAPMFISATPYVPASGIGAASARLVGPRLVEVSWTAGTAGSYPIAAYAVFRSDDGGSTFRKVGLTASLSLRDPVAMYGKRYLYLVRAVDQEGNLGDSYPTVIIDVELPVNRLFLNHNRFRPGTGEALNIQYQITEPGRVRISVFAMTGELVKKLYEGERGGSYTPDAPFNTSNEGLTPVEWNGANGSGSLVGSGAYFVVLEINKNRDIRSVAVIR
jgi:hypothetical protein